MDSKKKTLSYESNYNPLTNIYDGYSDMEQPYKINQHNGYPVSEIKFNPSARHFITYSQEDQSIIRWLIDSDGGKIQFDKYFKFSNDDLFEFTNQEEPIFIYISDFFEDNLIVSFKLDDTHYHRFIDISKGAFLDVTPIGTQTELERVGYFTSNNDFVIVGYIEKKNDNNYTIWDTYLYRYTYNSARDKLSCKPTLYINLNNDGFYPNILSHFENFLVAHDYTLISQWDTTTFSHKKSFYLLDQTCEHVAFNKDKTIVVLHYTTNSKLVVYSMERNITVSSFDLGKKNVVKKLDFIYSKHTNYQYLLVITHNDDTEKYNCKIMDPYGLENDPIDNTDYFYENIINVTTKDNISFGPIFQDNKMIIVHDNNEIYVKNVINNEILDDVERIHIKNNYNIYIYKILLEVYEKAWDYNLIPKITIKTGKSIQWIATYNDERCHIIIKVQKKNSDDEEGIWNTIDEYPIYTRDKFIHCRVLINDDLFLTTNENIQILSLNNKSRIFVKYIKTVYFHIEETPEDIKKARLKISESLKNCKSIEEHLFDFKDTFEWTHWSNIGHENKNTGQPYKTMILHMLDDFYYLSKYGREILDRALDGNDGVIVEKVLNSCLYHFTNDIESNLSVLCIIVSELPRIEQTYYKLLSKFFAQTSIILFPFENSTYPVTKFYKANCEDDDLIIVKQNEGSIYDYIYDFYQKGKGFVNEHIHDFNKSDECEKNITFKSCVRLIIPFPGLYTYTKDYSFWKELLYKPTNNAFVEFDSLEMYKHWNGKVLLDLKWDRFGYKYYYGIWFIYMIFLLSFSLATSTNDDMFDPSVKNSLLYGTIILGLFHLNFEVRQFVWDPKEYIFDFWNLFDFGAYFIPVVTSVLLLCDHEEVDKQILVSLVSASSLLLDLKFLLFLRVTKYFGIYFAIVIGVARKVFSFLVILAIIILSFAHAFHLLLKPSTPINVEEAPTFDNNISNNPWNLATRYYTYSESTNSRVEDSFLMQPPDENTNMFAYYKSSTLAMYNFLTGDNGAFGAWELGKNAYLTVLVIVFSFIVVVYLMNLFIGLLSNEIDGFNKDELLLLQKGKILSEIELFYLLPNQRRWKHWFPDVLHYYVPIDDIREKIREYDNSNEGAEFLPFISGKLRTIAEMPEPVSHDSKINFRLEKIGNSLERNENDLREIENNLRNDLRNDMKEIEDNLKNELMTQIQILMNEIKTLKNNQ